MKRVLYSTVFLWLVFILCGCTASHRREITKDSIAVSAYVFEKYPTHNFNVAVEYVNGELVRHVTDEDNTSFQVYKDNIDGYSDNYMDSKYYSKLDAYAVGIVESYGDEAIDCFRDCSVKYCTSGINTYSSVFDSYDDYLEYAKEHGTLCVSYSTMTLTSLDDYNKQIDTALHYLKEQSGFDNIEITLSLPGNFQPVFLLGNDPEYREEVLRRAMIEVFGPEVFEDESDESDESD